MRIEGDLGMKPPEHERHRNLFERREKKSLNNDLIEISRDARKLNAKIEKNRLESLDEVGCTRIGEIKQRIESGFYDRQGVLKRVARKLLELFGL